MIQIEKSIDGVFGIQINGRSLVGADETTELWWPPWTIMLVVVFVFLLDQDIF